MLSVKGINQKWQYLDSWDLQVEFQINYELRSFNISNLDQVFLGEIISLRRAIVEKKRLFCFLDFGRSYGNDFLKVGSFSFIWKHEKNECHIGLLWIEPEFRGNGLATQILNEIIDYADQLGIVLTLHAIPFTDPEKIPPISDILRLKRFYTRFGFFSDTNKDRSNAYESSLDHFMKRLPES
ncbi:MAG: GNAT family N-acetyltransferase, partial [Promethearchaeota archaeon]